MQAAGQGPHIRTRTDQVAPCFNLFRCHVVGCAVHIPFHGQLAIAGAVLSHAKVEHHRAAGSLHHDVAGLDVTVHHTGHMRGMQGTCSALEQRTHGAHLRRVTRREVETANLSGTIATRTR